MKDIHDLDFDDLICLARKQRGVWERIEMLAQAGRMAQRQDVGLKVRDHIQAHARALAMSEDERKDIARQVVEDGRWTCRKNRRGSP